MKAKRILPLLAALTACVWLSVATSAVAQPPAGVRGGRGRGGPTGPQDMLKRLDKNDDGQLSKDEVPEPFWNRLSRLDANDDGVVSKDELSKVAGVRERMGRRDGRGPGAQEESDDADDDSPRRGPPMGRGGRGPGFGPGMGPGFGAGAWGGRVGREKADADEDEAKDDDDDEVEKSANNDDDSPRRGSPRGRRGGRGFGVSPWGDRFVGDKAEDGKDDAKGPSARSRSGRRPGSIARGPQSRSRRGPQARGGGSSSFSRRGAGYGWNFQSQRSRAWSYGPGANRGSAYRGAMGRPGMQAQGRAQGMMRGRRAMHGPGRSMAWGQPQRGQRPSGPAMQRRGGRGWGQAAGRGKGPQRGMKPDVQRFGRGPGMHRPPQGRPDFGNKGPGSMMGKGRGGRPSAAFAGPPWMKLQSKMDPRTDGPGGKRMGPPSRGPNSRMSGPPNGPRFGPQGEGPRGSGPEGKRPGDMRGGPRGPGSPWGGRPGR